MLKLRWLISIILIVALLETIAPVLAADAPGAQQDPQSVQETFSSIALLNYYTNSLDYIIQLNQIGSDANLANMPFANVPQELQATTSDFASNGVKFTASLVNLFELWNKQNSYVRQYRLNDAAAMYKQITDQLPAAQVQLSQIQSSVANTGAYINIGSLPSDSGVTLVYNEITAKLQQLSGMLDVLSHSPQLAASLKPTTLTLAIDPVTAYVGDEISFTGSLFSQGQPLAAREITILVNNSALVTVQTGAQGQFHGTFPLPYLYINQMPVQTIYYPQGNDVGIYLGASSPVTDTTVLYYDAQIALKINNTAYPGKEVLITGIFDYGTAASLTQRTAEFYLDDNLLKQVSVDPVFNQGVILDGQTSLGKHLITISAPAEGRYAPVIATYGLNVTLATTNLEVHLPVIGLIPGSFQIRGRVYSSAGPLSKGTIVINGGTASKQVTTADDGTFSTKIGIGLGFSLLGTQGITLQVHPQEPWNAPLTSTKNFFLINYVNFIIILIVLLVFAIYLPRRFKKWFRELPRKPTRLPGLTLPETNPVYTPKMDIALKTRERYEKEETTNSILFWYRIALKLVQSITKVIMKPQQTLREYGKETIPVLGPVGKYFLELTYLSEKRLYSKGPPDVSEIEKSQQLAKEIQKEAGRES